MGPVETMQSLLVTDQVRPGSKGTRGDLDELEQKLSVSGRVWLFLNGEMFRDRSNKAENLIDQDTRDLMT